MSISYGVSPVFVENAGRNSCRNSVFGINPIIVRDRPLVALSFDGLDRRTVCSSGGGPKTDCTTDGGDTPRGTWVVASIQHATARTTARIDELRGEEQPRRFGHDEDVPVDALDLRLPFAMTG